MLLDYLAAGMRRAKYEILPGTEGFYGEIPGLDGVYATSETLEGCRTELQEVLEGWLLLRVARHLEVPELDGIQISVDSAA